MAGRPRLSKDDPSTLEIVRLYSEGMSPAKIAKIVFFCETTVRQRLRFAGLIPRPNPKWHIPQHKIEQIRALCDEGYGTYKVAAITGISVPTVRKYVRNREINYA